MLNLSEGQLSVNSEFFKYLPTSTVVAGQSCFHIRVSRNQEGQLSVNSEFFKYLPTSTVVAGQSCFHIRVSRNQEGVCISAFLWAITHTPRQTSP